MQVGMGMGNTPSVGQRVPGPFGAGKGQKAGVMWGQGAKGQRCQREQDGRPGTSQASPTAAPTPPAAGQSLANIVSTKLLSQYNPSVFILTCHGWQYPLGPSAVGICKLSFHGSAVCAVKTSYFVPKAQKQYGPSGLCPGIQDRSWCRAEG